MNQEVIRNIISFFVPFDLFNVFSISLITWLSSPCKTGENRLHSRLAVAVLNKQKGFNVNLVFLFFRIY